MKQYLLTEDQIERMLACAINLGMESTMDDGALFSRTMEEKVKSPEKGAYKNAIILFRQIKQIEFIQPINQN